MFRLQTSISEERTFRPGSDGPHRRTRHARRLPPSQIWPLVSALLTDFNRGVRIRAASFLRRSRRRPTPLRTARISSALRPSSSPRNASMPTGRNPAQTLGNFLAQRRLAAEAEAEFQAALRLSPQYAPAAANLADLYRQLGRDGEGETVLRTALVLRRERPGSVSRSG